MSNAVKILALIPARGGSVRLPRKNVLPCAGRPLIHITIETARAVTPPLARIVVSTDDAEIAEVSRAAGAEVPFMRPAALATPETASLDVVRHALEQLKAAKFEPDWVLLLQPTSPLRTVGDIEAAVDLANGTACDSVISVVRLQHEHPCAAKRIAGGFLRPFVVNAAEGDKVEPAYANNGAIYLTRTAVILNQNSLYGDASVPYVMPRERSIDVDTAFDLKIASIRLDSGQLGS